MNNFQFESNKVAEILSCAGGTIVGRTKIQKIGYLLELTGQGFGFKFEYRHYGPYSENLAEAIQSAIILDLITEEEKIAKWGGQYSIYKIKPNANFNFNKIQNQDRINFVTTAASIDSIDLELAATAAYLYKAENCSEPWEETMRRKPEKATVDRIQSAKQSYKKLFDVKTLKSLPEII